MPAVSITGCVLGVRSSCSLGPPWISRPPSSPSAAEASCSVERTAGWSPQASSMPTLCEPWPGNTNANAVMGEEILLFSSVTTGQTPGRLVSGVLLVVDQRCTPCEAAADAFKQQALPALDLAGTDGDVERQRNRGGRRVAVFGHRHHPPLRRQLQLAGRA